MSGQRLAPFILVILFGTENSTSIGQDGKLPFKQKVSFRLLLMKVRNAYWLLIMLDRTVGLMKVEGAN